MSLYRSVGAAPDMLGKRYESGTVTPGGLAFDVVTGLATVDSCGVSLAVAPSIDHAYSFAQPSATPGSVRINSYKPTSSSDPTPAGVSAGEALEVTWWAIGD